jgi:peroxiredoxin
VAAAITLRPEAPVYASLLLHALLTIAGVAPEGLGAPLMPPAIAVGEPAPDFRFMSADDHWETLHSRLAQGRLLLVFDPDETLLAEIEREHETLREHGVVPMVVTHLRDDAAWSLAQRLGITFSLLSDPERTVAEAFGVASADAGAAPRWFAIGGDGLVRASGEALAPPAGADRPARVRLAPAALSAASK